MTIPLFLRALNAFFLLAGTAAASAALVFLFVKGRSFAERWCAAGVAAAGVSTFGFHALASIGRFRPAEGLAGVALLVLFSSVLLARAGRSWPEVFRAAVRDFRLLRLILRPGPVMSSSTLRWVLIVFASGALLRAALLPPLGWDTLTSHGVKAALWVRGGGGFDFDAPAGWGISRHYFGGAEIFQAWAMLPFHGDLLTGLVDWAEWIFLGLAAFGLGRELGLRARHAAAAGAYLLFVPAVFAAVGSGYSELALNGMLLAGTLFGIRFLRSRDRTFLFLSIVAIGLAAGMKITMLPVLAMFVAFFVVDSLTAARERWERLRVLAAGAAVAATAVLPWIVENIRATGFPLACTPVRIFGVDLGVANRALVWYVDRSELRGFVAARELSALRAVFLPPWSHGTHLGFLTLVPLALFAPGFVILARRRAKAAILLAAISSVVLASYFQSGFTVVRLLWASTNGRFLLPIAGLALPAGFLALRTRRRFADRYAAFLLVAASIHASRQALFEVAGFEWPLLAAGVFLLAAGVYAGLRVFRRVSFVRTPAGATITLALAAIFIVLLLDRVRSGIRYRAAKQSIVFHRIPTDWVPAAEMVDEPDRERTIAVTAGLAQDADNWFLFPFFGRSLQNRLVYVPPARDGRIVEFGPDGELSGSAEAGAWLRRLESVGASEVMSFAPASIELGWMSSQPENFEKLAGDGEKWGLYRVVSREPARTTSSPVVRDVNGLPSGEAVPFDSAAPEGNR